MWVVGVGVGRFGRGWAQAPQGALGTESVGFTYAADEARTRPAAGRQRVGAIPKGGGVDALTEAEVAYLAGQRLGRLATVDGDGAPHVVPTGFQYNPELGTIDVGGHDLERSKKFRDVLADGRVAIVVDDLASTDPWRPRGIEIRGEAVALADGAGPVIRIVPRRIVTWGIDDPDPFRRHGRTVR